MLGTYIGRRLRGVVNLAYARGPKATREGPNPAPKAITVGLPRGFGIFFTPVQPKSSKHNAATTPGDPRKNFLKIPPKYSLSFNKMTTTATANDCHLLQNFLIRSESRPFSVNKRHVIPRTNISNSFLAHTSPRDRIFGNRFFLHGRTRLSCV